MEFFNMIPTWLLSLSTILAFWGVIWLVLRRACEDDKEARREAFYDIFGFVYVPANDADGATKKAVFDKLWELMSETKEATLQARLLPKDRNRIARRDKAIAHHERAEELAKWAGYSEQVDATWTELRSRSA